MLYLINSDPNRRVNYLAEAFLLAGIAILSILLFGFLGLVISNVAFGLSIEEIQAIVKESSNSKRDANLMKLNQSFAMLGMFIGAIVFFIVTRKPIQRHLGLKSFKPILALCSLGLVVAISPFIAFVVEKTQGAIEQLGFHNDKLMGAYNALGNYWDTPSFVFTLIVMAILPPLAEEFLFRGAIQKHLSAWTAKPHLAIGVTALIFAFIHGNPNQVAGLIILGLVLGYLMYLTGSIIYPILFHFGNNFLAILALHEEQKGNELEYLSNGYEPGIAAVLVSLAATVGILLLIKKLTPHHE